MIYTINKIRPKREGGGLVPLGSRSEVVAAFARMNTAPDEEGSRFLYGPGMRVELAVDPSLPGASARRAAPQATVVAAEVKIAEEELFEIMFQGTRTEFPGLLARMIRRHGWQLVNLETGSCYPPPPPDDEDDS
jgi:hypothetical protein